MYHTITHLIYCSFDFIKEKYIYLILVLLWHFKTIKTPIKLFWGMKTQLQHRFHPTNRARCNFPHISLIVCRIFQCVHDKSQSVVCKDKRELAISYPYSEMDHYAAVTCFGVVNVCWFCVHLELTAELRTGSSTLTLFTAVRNKISSSGVFLS